MGWDGMAGYGMGWHGMGVGMGVGVAFIRNGSLVGLDWIGLDWIGLDWIGLVGMVGEGFGVEFGLRLGSRGGLIELSAAEYEWMWRDRVVREGRYRE